MQASPLLPTPYTCDHHHRSFHWECASVPPQRRIQRIDRQTARGSPKARAVAFWGNFVVHTDASERLSAPFFRHNVLFCRREKHGNMISCLIWSNPPPHQCKLHFSAHLRFTATTSSRVVGSRFPHTSKHKNNTWTRGEEAGSRTPWSRPLPFHPLPRSSRRQKLFARQPQTPLTPIPSPDASKYPKYKHGWKAK